VQIRLVRIHENKKMKRSLFALILIALGPLQGATPDKDLNPKLFPIYEEITTKGKDFGISGKEFEVDLILKFGSEKFLVFSDAYLLQDKDTKYQIAKWVFAPAIVSELNNEHALKCRVRFRIDQVVTEPPYSEMPHVVATVLDLKPLSWKSNRPQ